MLFTTKSLLAFVVATGSISSVLASPAPVPNQSEVEERQLPSPPGPNLRARARGRHEIPSLQRRLRQRRRHPPPRRRPPPASPARPLPLGPPRRVRRGQPAAAAAVQHARDAANVAGADQDPRQRQLGVRVEGGRGGAQVVVLRAHRLEGPEPDVRGAAAADDGPARGVRRG
ncbi:hypothetical protein PG995_005023 [Apiospora arundinis]